MGMLTAFLFLVPLAAFAASNAAATSYTITITSPTSGMYIAPDSTITVSGAVSPPPTANGTYIGVSVLEPNGQIATANEFPVALSTGDYSGSIATGGPNFATMGVYTIDVNYEGTPQSVTVMYGNVTSATAVASVTTIIQSTTIIESTATTVTLPGTTTTIISSTGTTVTSVVTSLSATTTNITTSVPDSTALAIGAVGVIIAIIAAVLAVLAMRKK